MFWTAPPTITKQSDADFMPYNLTGQFCDCKQIWGLEQTNSRSNIFGSSAYSADKAALSLFNWQPTLEHPHKQLLCKLQARNCTHVTRNSCIHAAHDAS